MVDLGQATTQQERRERAKNIPFANQRERDLRNRAIETDAISDWSVYHAARLERLS